MNNPSNTNEKTMMGGNPLPANAVFLPTKAPATLENGSNAEVVATLNDAAAYSLSPVQWSPSPVVDWVESLAAATEAEERKASSYMQQNAVQPEPLKLGDVYMSQKSIQPELTPQQSESYPFFFPKLNVVSKVGKMNNIFELDPEGSLYTREIAYLAVEWKKRSPGAEQDAQFQRILIRLEGMMQRFLLQHHQLQSQEDGEVGTTRQKLTHLYKDTIDKMWKLSLTVSSQNDNVSVVSTSDSSPPSSPTKDKLKDFMNAWLQENWTNPYPDDFVLQQMAIHLGTSPATIVNWLINARTRKWRPAIVKACEEGRPSHCLFQDSIDNFTGEPRAKRLKTEH